MQEENTGSEVGIFKNLKNALFNKTYPVTKKPTPAL